MPSPNIVMQGVILLISLGALMISVLTFVRYDQWRKADKTEITIKQVDSQARQDVSALGARFEARATKVDNALDAVTKKIDAEVDAINTRVTVTESELRNAFQVMDSRLRREMEGQGKQLATLVERTQHSPSQADISAIRETMAKMHGDVSANGAKTDGVVALVNRINSSVERIEEHHFRDR